MWERAAGNALMILWIVGRDEVIEV